MPIESETEGTIRQTDLQTEQSLDRRADRALWISTVAEAKPTHS